MASRYSNSKTFNPVVENFGYIYVAKAEGVRGYKIGKTINWKERLTQIAGQLPVKVEYEYVFKCGDIHFTETVFHEHFAVKRIQLEWFDLNTDDLTQMEEILGKFEPNVVIAVNRRIEGRVVKNASSRRPVKELPPLDTCPICNRVYRRKRANYVTCSYECHIEAAKRGGYGILPRWIWVQAGGVPSWVYNDGIAPNMNFTRDGDNLAWEYHRLVDRD